MKKNMKDKQEDIDRDNIIEREVRIRLMKRIKIRSYVFLLFSFFRVKILFHLTSYHERLAE